MAQIPETLDNIRVLLCLADEDQGHSLAHALREEGLDVLVAHRIKAAMRVMEKESPQAVVVEVATKAFDGFRVAQWASGRVMAIFLVAGRELTLMEDVEVLKSGAKEVFYQPLQAATIASSIRGGCGVNTQQALGPEAAAPKTRFSAPPSVMKQHHPAEPGPEPEPERQPLVEWDTAVMGQVQGEAEARVKAGEMDTLVDANDPAAGNAGSSLREEVHRQLAARPQPEAAPEPAPEPAVSAPKAPSMDDDLLPYSTAEDETSASLVDDLFDDPLSTPSAALAKKPEPAPNRPKSRKIEAPPDDDLLMAGMMDELDDLAPDSIYGAARQRPPSSRVVTQDADPDAASSEADGETEDNKQTSPTALEDGPATADIIAAFQSQSKAPQWIARALAVAVVGASAWLGSLVVERMDFGSGDEETTEIPEVTPEEAAAAAARQKLHETLSEAAISHREGDLDVAKKGYLDALVQDPESDIAARGLVAIEMTQKDWKKTRKALNRLAGIVPDDPALALQQGLVLQALKKKAPARAELRRFIDSTDPEDPRVRPAAQVYLSLTLGE